MGPDRHAQLSNMTNFSKDFFDLQVKFAQIIAQKYAISFHQAIFKYTSLYVRTLGFSDENPPFETNPQWGKIIAEIPQDQSLQGEYFYTLYLDFEKKQKPSHAGNTFGCFGYAFHTDTQNYELHFDAIDPKGNLGKDRMTERMKDLKEMFLAIYRENKEGTTFFVRTWLLNIEAFNRLFPKEFIQTTKK